jgi:4-amino-4-deoxy-L-arabinose transferase-like glycosyltransferase
MLRAAMGHDAKGHAGGVVLGLLVVAFGLWRLAPGLSHPSIHNWDEAAHQAVTRGTRASFFRPHIYAADLYPNPPENWMGASVFLHKPTAPFWFGALMMRLVGVTPLALRLGSLLGALAAALCILVLLRQLHAPAAGALGALGFLALPFGYALCQGYMFGDATDCTLAGWVSLAVLALVLSVERDDARLATLAGAATGTAYLCKTALGLAPLGLAMGFAVLGALGVTRRLRWRGLLGFVLALLVVAVPWNLYTAFAFPDVYRFEARHTLDHLFTDAVAQWVRPWDGLLNEVNQTELDPLPPALALVALGFGVVRAVRRRETVVVALVGWVACTWVVLSIARAKVPATAWGAVPGAIALIALLAWEARRSAVALGLVAGAGLSTVLLAHQPWLAGVAQALPSMFAQTRTRPALAVGLLLALGLCSVLGLAARLLPRVRGRGRVGSGLAGAAALLLLGAEVVAQSARAKSLSVDAAVAPMREVGLAIDAHVPEQSVIFLGVERDPACCFDQQDLIFWSGRPAYRREVDLPMAAAHALHPYLVSTAAEPFAEVPGVPAFAEARAFDLLAPGPPPSLPVDATPLALAHAPRLLAFAHGPREGRDDVWVFYVRGQDPQPLQIRFTPREGSPFSVTVPVPRAKQAGAPWVVASVVGPARAGLGAVLVDGEPLPLGP